MCSYSYLLLICTDLIIIDEMYSNLSALEGCLRDRRRRDRLRYSVIDRIHKLLIVFSGETQVVSLEFGYTCIRSSRCRYSPYSRCLPSPND
jgi:hypothetical protein